MFEDKKVDLVEVLDALRGEWVTLSNQPHAISDNDLKEVVFNNGFGHLESLVPGLRAFHDYISLMQFFVICNFDIFMH